MNATSNNNTCPGVGVLTLAGLLTASLGAVALGVPPARRDDPRPVSSEGTPIVIAPRPTSGGTGGGGGEPTPDPEPELPEMIELTGVVRDFLETSEREGHIDFEREPDNGFGHYCGNIAQALSEDRKPIWTGGGAKVYSQWTDSAGVPICYTLFDEARGDVPGSQGPSDHGGVYGAETFDQWYRDVPGVNMSSALTIKMLQQPDGSYVFDDKLDETYGMLGGFFPIEGQLLGNSGGSPDRNFHFTYELHAEFEYDASANSYFQFIGDDDVFVFIDGRLVIDVGGVHNATEQFVDVSRLGLEDGETYTLDFFFAERHRTQSNFKIATTLLLQTVDFPTISAVFD